MANQPELGSPELSDDYSKDDSISVTSTVLSEQKDEYPVEAILAEEKFKGITKYLVKWEGYPEHQCTWETRSMFQDGEDSTFHEWETQKMRVSRGVAKPFDVPAFRKRVDVWLEGVHQRRLRRRAKRERMGLPVSPITIESDEDSSDSQAIEEEEVEPKVIRRRSSVKRRAELISDSSDESRDSEAVESASSDDTTVRSLWTSRQEAALLRGLKVCQGPDWTRIISLNNEAFIGFNTVDLEREARRIRASFRESGKEIPQELREVVNESSTTSKRTRREQQSQNTSREQSVAKPDASSETDDSLVEELRMKHEAKARKKVRRPDAVPNPQRPPERRKTTSREESVEMKHPNAQKVPQTPKERTRISFSSEALQSGKLSKPKTDLVESKRRESATHASRPEPLRSSVASRPSFVAATAPMMGAPKPMPQKAPSKPSSRMGGTGRGPRRATAHSIFIPKQRKRHATGAAVLSNWEGGKVHGNSSLAKKSHEIMENPDNRYNKLSIRRRAVKKGRTEPAPNMDNLQLIDPKDGKAVKKITVAVPASAPTKSAFEMILESRQPDREQNTDMHLDTGPHDTASIEANNGPDDTASLEAVEEELAMKSNEHSNMESTPVAPAPAASAMSSRVTQSSVESTIPTTALDTEPKKRPVLSLQAYSQKSKAAPSGPTTATPSSEPLPGETPSSDLSASKLTSLTSESDPNGKRHVSFKFPEHVDTSKKVSREAIPLSSDAFSPSDDHALPFSNLSSGSRPLPPGFAPRPTLPQSLAVSSSAEEMSGVQESRLASKAAIAAIRPSVTRVPSGPRAMASPSTIEKAPAETDASLTPEARDFLRSHDKYDVYGNVLIGAERGDLGSLRFRGFNVESRKRLIANKTASRENNFWFSSMCTAADYEAHFNKDLSDPLFCPGQIVPNIYTLAKFNDVRSILRLNVAGGLHLGKDFTLLIYPADSEDWAFLDQRLPEMHPIGLRCIIHSPMQSTVNESSNERLERTKKRLEEKGKELTFAMDELPINTVMRTLYGIDYERLVRQPNQDKTKQNITFLLIFPKKRKAEQDLIIQFLDANNAAEVYVYNEDKNDGIWTTSIGRIEISPRPPLPSRLHDLITDSLLLLKPLEALRILTWYRLRVFNEKPNSTWKLITRPNIRRCLINLSRERTLNEEGRRFVQIYEQIALMLDPDDLWDWEENAPKEEAPIYCMPKLKSFNSKIGRRVPYDKDLDHAAIARNDDVLADFFAGWANVHMHSYRRFHIISGFGDDGEGKTQRETWAEKWSYLEVFTPATLMANKLYNIPPQAELDREAVKKHKHIRGRLQAHEDEIEANAKAEEVESREQAGFMERDWRGQMEKNRGLREGFEAVMGSGVLEEGLGEAMMEREMEMRDEDDEWSRDGSSVSSGVEVGEVDEDNEMLDVGAEEDSEVDGWGLSEESSSSSDSE